LPSNFSFQLQLHKVTKLQRLQQGSPDASNLLQYLEAKGINTDKIVESHHAHQACLHKFVDL
jgi:hypothetical protein